MLRRVQSQNGKVYEMKKFLILLLTIVLLLASCSINLPNIRAKQLGTLINEESAKIEQMSNNIIKCFTEKDKEALKKLFCEQIRKRPNFDNDIDKAFEYFKCDVYINSNIDTIAGGGESIEDGKRISWDVMPEIPYINVIFDADGDESTPMENRYYSMWYYWHVVNDKDKSLEGLQYITIKLLNVSPIQLGKKIG